MSDSRVIRILMIEDDEVSRMVTERFLKSKGYEVETAVDGQKALALLGNEIYDIVLMDIALPKIDGFQLARQMKKHSRTQDIPIVAISAYTASVDFDKETNHVMEAFLSKPFSPEELLETIMRLTQIHQPELDWTGLLRRTDGDMDFLTEVAQLFCQNALNLITQINESSDCADINEYAHRLKGSAATAGALRLSELAYNMQQACDKKNIKQIRSLTKSFNSHLVNYIDYLGERGISLAHN